MKRLTEITDCNEYLSALEKIKDRYLVILCVANRPGQYIKDKIAENLQRLGLQKSLVGLTNKGYIAILDKGINIYEALSAGNEPVYYCQTYFGSHGDIPLRVTSNSASYGGRSEIIIEDKEYCVNSVGLNIVVYDTNVNMAVDAVGFSLDVPQLYCTRLENSFNDKIDRVHEFNAMKYGVARWCSDNGWNNVVIYSEKQYAPLINAVMQSFYIENRWVRQFFSSEAFGANSPRRFLGFQQFQKLKLDMLEKNDTVLILAPANSALAAQMEPFCFKVIQLDVLLGDIHRHLYATRPLLLFRRMHPNVTLATINLPGKQQDSAKWSEHEKIINSQNITRGTLRTLCIKKEKIPDTIEKNFGYNIQELEDLLAVPERYYADDGRKYFADKRYNKYMECTKDGRVTPAVPHEPSRTIYLLGGCTIFGVNAPDDQTIAAYLQSLLNENCAEERFAVENRGDFIADRLNDLYQSLYSLEVKDGDIVLIGSALMHDACFPNINMRNLFDRPHDFGEVWFENEHYSGYGHKAIAGELFNVLRENNFFQNWKSEIKELPVEDNHHSFGMPSAQHARVGWVLASANTHKEDLAKYKSFLRDIRQDNEGLVGAIVMNCNPFTLGHRYLIETAVNKVERLYIFVVEEDKSEFPYKDRIALIQAGVADLDHVTVLPSGKFIISSLTFTDYFNKAELQDKSIDATQDVTLFAEEIAPILGISIRFAGEEPLDNITKQYNESMRTILPQYGIRFEAIPRKESGGVPISASRVRKLLDDKDFEEIAKIVPETTLKYLIEKFGE